MTGVLFGDANVQVVHVDGVAVRQDVKPGEDIELKEHAEDVRARETV